MDGLAVLADMAATNSRIFFPLPFDLAPNRALAEGETTGAADEINTFVGKAKAALQPLMIACDTAEAAGLDALMREGLLPKDGCATNVARLIGVANVEQLAKEGKPSTADELLQQLVVGKLFLPQAVATERLQSVLNENAAMTGVANDQRRLAAVLTLVRARLHALAHAVHAQDSTFIIPVGRALHGVSDNPRDVFDQLAAANRTAQHEVPAASSAALQASLQQPSVLQAVQQLVQATADETGVSAADATPLTQAVGAPGLNIHTPIYGFTVSP